MSPRRDAKPPSNRGSARNAYHCSGGSPIFATIACSRASRTEAGTLVRGAGASVTASESQLHLPANDIRWQTKIHQLSHDYSFTIIPEAADFEVLHTHKRELYLAYLEKSPGVVKRCKRDHVGWEGQSTMTWFTVDHGKVKIVEAYNGDPSWLCTITTCAWAYSGSDQAWLFRQRRQLLYLTNDKIDPNEELQIAYRVASEKQLRRF